MRHLRQGVDAGIGSAGAVELKVLPLRQRAHGTIDLALHGPGVLLNLPPAVPGADIFDGELEAGHGLEFTIYKIQLPMLPSPAGRRGAARPVLALIGCERACSSWCPPPRSSSRRRRPPAPIPCWRTRRRSTP